MPRANRDMVGKRFSRLLVLRAAPGLGGKWECRCDCGREVTVGGSAMRKGNNKSCGCLYEERLHFKTHGHCSDPLFTTWSNMITRCTKPKSDHYKAYGGRGIKVCDRWMDFPNFRDDMGPRPAGHSLDRINNDGNYEPGNCRWATKQEQYSNLQRTVRLTCRGETLTQSEWARRVGVKPWDIKNRRQRRPGIDDECAVMGCMLLAGDHCLTECRKAKEAA